MFDFKKIEKKWQKRWEEEKVFESSNNSKKKKFYYLVEFPYPSGAGLHVGHVRSYTALDVMARKKRMQGFNVLYPMGWDAFGLPAEQYAIKNHIHPSKAVEENIKVFKSQIKSLGISFDWSREINTTDPKYYKWTQWQFLKFYENGMAYKAKKKINWCPSCKIGLSNEEAEGNVCERCGGPVEKKEKEQWMLKMSDYAERLLEGLNKTEFLDKIKVAQINWIGKSEGAEVDFKLKEVDDTLKVFTTRCDTLYGVTFMVISPEHEFLNKYKKYIKNIKEVEKYQKEAARKTEIERTDMTKEKTGVKIDGLTAINPVNNEEIEIWISDYVLVGYGTGAIMAVPAHDTRDYEFAKKFNIPIKQVIAKSFYGTGSSQIRKDALNTDRIVVNAVIKHPNEDKYLCVKNKEFNWLNFVMGGIENNESVVEAGKREIIEETGYTDINVEKEMEFVYFDNFYAEHKKVNRHIKCYTIVGKLNSLKQIERSKEESDLADIIWVDRDKLIDSLTTEAHKYDASRVLFGEGAMVDDGIHINSMDLDNLNKEEAINKMISILENRKIGTKKINYKLQDWVFSRQRFWGEPIPMIFCKKCGWVPVPYEELPVLLPNVTAYEPTDDGESPLARIPEWVNTTCPKCGEKAKRETDTMPNWAGSSWYYLRYMDPNNDKEFVSKEALKYWNMVDYYNGGMEHATRHLLYARFWHNFLYDQGLLPYSEPFNKRVAHGMILGPNGEKMSKSKGNVINPDDMVKEYGADALRCYELFIGDYTMDAAWSENGLKGCKKFLDRVYKLKDKINGKNEYTEKCEILINQTIKKVTNDLENMKYNTAVSSLMILLNEFDKLDEITNKDYRTLLHLLNPISPHITEELNEMCNLGEELCKSSWPLYDENKLISETFTMVVQVNGKVRGKIEVSSNTTEEEMKNLSKEIDNVKKYIEEKEIIKEIVVPKKLVNIVVK